MPFTTHTGAVPDPYFRDASAWDLTNFNLDPADPSAHVTIGNGKLEIVNGLGPIHPVDGVDPIEGCLVFYELQVDFEAVTSATQILFASNVIWDASLGTGFFSGFIDREWTYTEGLKIDIQSFSIPQVYQSLTLSKVAVTIYGDVAGRGRMA